MAFPRSRKHTCSVCQRTFKRFSHCIRHKKTHTKERPFKCAGCPKRYSRLDALQRHEKFDHDGEPQQQPDPKPDIHPLNIPMHSTSSFYANTFPLISEFSAPTEIVRPGARLYRPLSPPRNPTFDISCTMDHPATISAYDRLLQCEAFFPSVGSKPAIFGTIGEPTGAFFGCSQPHDSLSPLLSSPMASHGSILQGNSEAPDSDGVSFPLMKMFDPLLDPWSTRQEAVQSYMAEIGSVPEYHVHTWTQKSNFEGHSFGNRRDDCIGYI